MPSSWPYAANTAALRIYSSELVGTISCDSLYASSSRSAQCSMHSGVKTREPRGARIHRGTDHILNTHVTQVALLNENQAGLLHYAVLMYNLNSFAAKLHL